MSKKKSEIKRRLLSSSGLIPTSPLIIKASPRIANTQPAKKVQAHSAKSPSTEEVSIRPQIIEKKVQEVSSGHLPEDWRGLVVSNPIRRDGTGVYIESTDLDPQLLRQNLLFWDVLDFPSDNHMHMGTHGEVQLLIDQGIIVRSAYKGYFKGDHAEVKSWIFNDLLETRISESPGRWAASTGPNSFQITPSKLIKDRGTVFSLINSIPIPTDKTEISEILEFKRANYNQLTDLRIRIEELYQEILRGSDEEQALLTQHEKLKRDIEKYDKSLSKAGIASVLGSIASNYNLLAPSTGALTSYLANADPLLGAAIGATSALVVTKGDIFRASGDDSSPYQYISSFKKYPKRG